ncbi:hypothetical protein FP2506_14514 [Fulvimarina pelagi HTCC2506]|uniref:Uncharacterized protein n=1 Tax=Fulvimarina pelagi HTCC2506 TaxID=314231 RepID=Q0G427_9HYPH|nr:hypothetical protein FP2506_14514 [Fulvimarina pelagi HTCC2506]
MTGRTTDINEGYFGTSIAGVCDIVNKFGESRIARSADEHTRCWTIKISCYCFMEELGLISRFCPKSQCSQQWANLMVPGAIFFAISGGESPSHFS